MRSRSSHTQRPKGEIRSLRPMLVYLRPYRLQMAGAVVAIVFTSSSILGMGWGLKYLIDEGLSKNNAALLDRAFIILIGVTMLLALASYTRFFLVSWIGERVVADIRRDVYGRLVSLHIGFFENTRTGELLSRLTTDTTLLQTVIGSSISVAARNALSMTGAIILLLITSTHLTGYVALMVPLVVAPIILLGRRVRWLARESQNKVADISAHAEETLSAIRTVQALAIEPYEKARFAGHVDAALGAAESRIKTRALLTALVITMIFGAIVTVLWFGGKDVLAGRITPGELSAFIFYSVIVAGAAGAISEVIGDLQRAAGAAERLQELLEVDSLIPSPQGGEGREGVSASTSKDGGSETCPLPARGASHPLPLEERGLVVFDRVSFIYPMRPDKQAICDFSLRAEPGRTVALVGPSGAGKTTLFQLLLRFYDPSAGTITINGRDIRDMPLAQLRGMIGLVPQEPVIFSGSARENIRLGKLDASDEEIMQAVSMASALEFLEKLPHGLDTHLGEKGVQLSGGQKQRIAIARAIVRNPRILLLDEATSALDSRNEHQIQQALARVMQGRTTFVIAHRLSTITRADTIILLSDGRIEASGTHTELLASSPLYARLAELQFKDVA